MAAQGRMPIAGLLLGLVFAVVLGASFSFLTSPWSMADVNLEALLPILAGAGIGFAFGLLASRWLRAGWAVWLLTAPGVGGFVWLLIEQCEASRPGDDCGIVGLLFAGWLVPWAIGVGALGVATAVAGRRDVHAPPAPDRPGLDRAGSRRLDG